MPTIDAEIIVIGAGVIGLAIAERLSRSGKQVIIVEKENSFGQHTSSRNSEVIHSGIYYQANSLKSKLCIEGNKMLYDFAHEHNIHHKKCGKFIICQKGEEGYLIDILSNGKRNGIEGLTIAKDNIPDTIKYNTAVWVPSTGIIDSHALMYELNRQIGQRNNVYVGFGCNVRSIQYDRYEGGTFRVGIDDFHLTSKILINCAGLWADKIANLLFPNQYRLEFWKGDYYKTNKIKNLNHLIYPLPRFDSLGIHTRINLDGSVSFGPNAYRVYDVDYNIDERFKESFLSSINEYIELGDEDIFPDYSGIRPRLSGNEGNKKDFIIKNEIDNGFRNMINLIGIESPGLTCCLSIAKYVEGIIV